MPSTNAAQERPVVTTAGKIGAALFALWGVLHVWVGAEGSRRYLSGGSRALLDLFLGGPNAPRGDYQFATDAVTANVNGHLALNFVLDVGASGLLGLALAWLIWKQGSWAAYFIAVVVIGVIDNAFVFTQVVPGLIEGSIETWGGPAIWVLACIVTPFGLKTSRAPAEPELKVAKLA